MERADDCHRLDDAGLNVTRLRLGGARGSAGVAGRHHPRLPANDGQDAPVADDEDGEDDDVEREEIPEEIDRPDRAARPHRVRVADAVHHGARQRHEDHAVYERCFPGTGQERGREARLRNDLSRVEWVVKR